MLDRLIAMTRFPEQRHDDEDTLPGDELLPDAGGAISHSITIAAGPAQIWPWLVQMGCRRAGFYSIDIVDNGGARSAREIHPELQTLQVGQVIPATPGDEGGFEVLVADEPRALVLGGLWDRADGAQLPFDAPRPDRYWHVTWAFVLEPAGDHATRLRVRARAAYSHDARWHALGVGIVHRIMQRAQLRNLTARIEGRQPRDDWRDVLEGIAGAARMIVAVFRPRRRAAAAQDLAQHYPGDDLVPAPRWGWTHAAAVDRPAAAVWPWLAQLGADRGGFYSYQWLENLVGCRVRNAETIHPEWQVMPGDRLVLHPKAPPLPVVEVEPGRYFLAFAGPDEHARQSGEPWVAASWLLAVEPVDEGHCRVISRYRVATSDHLRTRLSFGPALVEPIGGTMDERMIRGIKERAEAQPWVAHGPAVHPRYDAGA